MSTSKWIKYYEDTKDYPPSPLLVKSMEYVVSKDKAIDIGDGGLKDARYLLEQGFEVMVIDAEPTLAERAEAFKDTQLHYQVTRFDEFDFPKNEYDIATAMFALPFNPPNSFDHMFENVKQSLKKDGIFCGQFFGVNDEWNTPESKLTFHTKEQVEHLLLGMEIIIIAEDEKDGKTSAGTPKHWHTFRVIAKKR